MKQRKLFPAYRRSKGARRNSLASLSDPYTEGQLECARLIVAEPNKYRGFLLDWARSFLEKHGTTKS